MPRVTLVYGFVHTLPLADWQPDLPSAYSDRLTRMRSARARNQTLAGLWLLQQGAKLAGFGDLVLSALERNTDNRPCLPEGPEFNISHSGDLAACVIACDRALGLDVEKVRPVDTTRLGRFLSPNERSAAVEDIDAFFSAWTAREAVVKATGRAGLARIARVQFPGSDQATVDGERLHVQRLELAAGYKACLASVDTVPPVLCHKLPHG